MDTKALVNLSKEELIQIIENIKKKENLTIEDILPLQIDYFALVEATSDIIIVLDKNENLVFRNQSWRNLFPSMPDRDVGAHFSEYIPINELDRAADVIATVLSEGVLIDDEMFKTYDEHGNPLYFISSWSPVKGLEGDITGLVGIMKNVTERVLIQKKFKSNSKILEEKVKEYLQQSEELKNLRDQNEDIINNSPIGIFMMDPSGIMLSENSALKKIMGHGQETRIGVNLLHYSGFIDVGFDRLFEKCLREKKTVDAKNKPYVPISGDRELIVNISMIPFLDDQGLVKKVMVMVEDNTEQARVAREINRADKVSSIGKLAQGVAQELRRPINRMYMDLNFVENNVDKDSRAAEYLGEMKKELHLIKNVSEQLLALSGPEEGDKGICEINRIFTIHPIDIMLKRLRDEGHNIVLELPDESPTIKATQNQLKQILFDLIENSQEAMPDKGTLRINVDMVEAVEGPFATISITDTGVGMPEENLKKIFQPFFSTKGEEATGLGLMIASTVVENLGGKIGVKTAPGEGTSFRIALPLIRSTFEE